MKNNKYINKKNGKIYKEENYFQNGVIFDWINDNVIAFENIEGEKFTYWEVQRNEKL